MSAVIAGIPKPQHIEIRGITPEKKKKVPRGWPTCPRRSPPKATFHNNDICKTHKQQQTPLQRAQ